jgi:hypothetical protein
VAAAAHRYQQAVVSGEINGGNHISGSSAVGDNRGSMLDHRVVDLARRIVSIVAWKQMATAQSCMELVDRLCVDYDLATRRRRDFDIRHVRPSLTFGTSHQTRTACHYRRRIFTRSVMNSPARQLHHRSIR